MNSKMVSDRIKSARAVEGSVRENADAIAARVSARLRPYLARGEAMPDVALFLRLLGREVAGRADTMKRADDAHESELADDTGPRRARDQHAADTREIYSDIRGTIGSVYGEDALALLRLAEPASSDPLVLAEQGQRAREALLDESIVLPKPRRKGAKIQRAELADELSASVVALAASLTDVEREKKEADATLSRKNASIDENDATFGVDVAAIAAVYHVVGEEMLAGKLRINPRRPGQLEGPVDGGDPEQE